VLVVKLVRGKLKYRIQWVGWDEDPEWYPASMLSNSPLALQRFYDNNIDLPGPPQNLQYWLDYTKNNTLPESRRTDNRPHEVT